MRIGLKCDLANEELKNQVISYLRDEGYETIDLMNEEGQESLESSKWVIEKEWTSSSDRDEQTRSSYAAMTANQLPGVSLVGVKETSMTSVKAFVDLSEILSMANELWIKPALYRQLNYKNVCWVMKKTKGWMKRGKKTRKSSLLDED